MDEEQPVNETAERDVQASLVQAHWAETNQVDRIRYEQIAAVAADAARSTVVRLLALGATSGEYAMQRKELRMLMMQAHEMAFQWYASERGG
jgi:hypothetical protein